MKFSNLIKFMPFLSALLIILFLSISNNKEYTKLRILIWNTPKLTLGNYLAISAGTGFILSYILTTNLARFNQTIYKNSLRSEDKNQFDQTNDFIDTNTNLSYNKTLIERDIKEPSPTINASFRIIGRTKNIHPNNRNNIDNKVDYNQGSIQIEEEYEEHSDNNKTRNQVSSISSDWNDESFSTW